MVGLGVPGTFRGFFFPETNSSPPKIRRDPKQKEFSNHPFSGVLVYQSVSGQLQTELLKSPHVCTALDPDAATNWGFFFRETG